MDDNALPYRANIVDECLQSEDITRMDWPAYSLDLNPIEHVWDNLADELQPVNPLPSVYRNFGCPGSCAFRSSLGSQNDWGRFEFELHHCSSDFDQLIEDEKDLRQNGSEKPFSVNRFLASKNIPVAPQPPYSPDLSPCDFSSFRD
ncbi:DDE_3 domain-containing protein [Trichonephila clavipes]|nr:DDE_3 domain-containing protein [Trichonephila clavipes]